MMKKVCVVFHWKCTQYTEQVNEEEEASASAVSLFLILNGERRRKYNLATQDKNLSLLLSALKVVVPPEKTR